MRKYLIVLVGLFFSAVMAGCGTGSSTNATIVSGKPSKIAVTGVEGKTLVIKSINTDIQLNSDSKYTDNKRGTSGDWVIVDGNIVLTGGTTRTFTQIQASTGYSLVYDIATNEISRMFVDNETKLAVDAAAEYVPRNMGGAVQGTPLNLTKETCNVSTIAGSTTGISGFVNYSGASATNATFNHPIGITTDGENYYVADYTNNQIRVINKSATKVTLLAGSTSGEFGLTDASGTSARFYKPNGITLAGEFLYVVDSGYNTIRRVSKSGVVDTFAGSAGTSGSVDANGTSARFNAPTGITSDGTNLYVADSGNHTIRKIDIASKDVTTLAGSPGKIGSENGIYDAARFNLPTRITTDGSNLYVADFENRTIRRIVIATASVDTLAGTAGLAPESLDGTGPAAKFYHLGGITTDGTNVFVTDFNDTIKDNPQWRNLIRKIVISTGEVVTIAGGLDTKVKPVAVDATGVDARFYTPMGITVNGREIFVTDFELHNIRKIIEKP